MKNYVKEFLENVNNIKIKISEADFVVRNPYVCEDGTELSIQASRYHYCTPRETLLDQANYETVEVLVFNGNDTLLKEWKQYLDSIDENGETLYGYVPVDLVNSFISKHNQNSCGDN